MSVLNLTGENFEEEVMKEEKPVLIDFWASWCGPCRMVSPIVDEIAEEYSDKVKVCKVNVDDEPNLATSFEIMSIPTLIVIKNGKLHKRTVGAKSKEEILELVD